MIVSVQWILSRDIDQIIVYPNTLIRHPWFICLLTLLRTGFKLKSGKNVINVWQNGTFDLVLDEVLGPLLTWLNLLRGFMGFRIILVFGGLKVLNFTVFEAF